MDTLDLLKRIKIVFNDEKNHRIECFSKTLEEIGQKTSSFWYSRIIKSHGISSLGISKSYIDPDEYSKIVNDTSEYMLNYKNLDRLKNLFGLIQHSEILKNEFIYYLKREITDSIFQKETDIDESYADMSDLAFAVLVKIGQLDNAIFCLEERNKKKEIDSCVSILSKFIRYDYNLFSNEHLEKLKKILENATTPAGHPLLEVRDSIMGIDKINTKRLDLEIEGINFEFNQDKKEILIKFHSLGFPKELTIALNKIEEYYWQRNDEFDYSAAIDKIREFQSLFYKILAEKIKEKTDVKIEMREDGKGLDYEIYVKSNLELSEGTQLIKSGLRKISNEKGSHKLTSEKEYFRITKNINIEHTILLLTILEKWKK